MLLTKFAQALFSFPDVWRHQPFHVVEINGNRIGIVRIEAEQLAAYLHAIPDKSLPHDGLFFCVQSIWREAARVGIEPAHPSYQPTRRSPALSDRCVEGSWIPLLA